MNEVWEPAMTYTFGKHNLAVDPRKQGGPIAWSPGHIPDITTGTKVAQKGDYDPARQLGHLPILLLHEVSGAMHPESYRFLRQMAEMHDNKLPYDLHGQSWTVQSFTTYFLQRFSSAVITWLSRRRSAAGSTPAAACPRLHPEAGAASGFGLLRARDARRAAARPPLA